MRVAYLVITHRNPRLLQKAIEKLSSEGWSFFIHVDQKADAREFSEIAGDNIFFTRTRIPVYWGEFSQVQAAVLLMRQALECHPPCDWLLLSTGSDYPLRSREYIHAFLEESRGLEFMSMVKMPAPGKPILRINLVRFPSTQPIRRFASRALAKAGLARRDHRKHLRGMDPFSGEGCWAISRGACEYLLDFMEHNPFLERYFKNTFAPDESFFHTILGNSPFGARARRYPIYADWSASGTSGHPAIITDRQVAFFEHQEKVWVDDMYGSGEALFARKFSDANLEILERIDEMIRNKEDRCAR